MCRVYALHTLYFVIYCTYLFFGSKLGFSRILDWFYSAFLVFTRSAIIPPKVNRFGWNLEHSEYILGDWCRQILGAIRTVEQLESQAKYFVMHYKTLVILDKRWILLSSNEMTFDIEARHAVSHWNLYSSKGQGHMTKCTVTGWQMFLFQIWMHIRPDELTVDKKQTKNSKLQISNC